MAGNCRAVAQRNAKFGDWAELADGCYLLRSNLTDVDAATLRQRYIQLIEAERAFRITKDELEIRPIWHQKEDRVLAHTLVCFRAFAIWKTLAGWMNSARTLLHEFAKIKNSDIVLPAQTADGTDPAQSVLLHRLGLTFPRRFDTRITRM